MSPVAGSVFANLGLATVRPHVHTHLNACAFIRSENLEGYLSRRFADLYAFPRRKATRTLDLFPVKPELLSVFGCGDFEWGEGIQEVDRCAKDPIIDLCQGGILVSHKIFKRRPR